MFAPDGDTWDVRLRYGLKPAKNILLVVSEDGLRQLQEAHRAEDVTLLEYEFALANKLRGKKKVLLLLCKDAKGSNFSAFSTEAYAHGEVAKVCTCLSPLLAFPQLCAHDKEDDRECLTESARGCSSRSRRATSPSFRRPSGMMDQKATCCSGTRHCPLQPGPCGGRAVCRGVWAMMVWGGRQRAETGRAFGSRDGGRAAPAFRG